MFKTKKQKSHEMRLNKKDDAFIVEMDKLLFCLLIEGLELLSAWIAKKNPCLLFNFLPNSNSGQAQDIFRFRSKLKSLRDLKTFVPQALKLLHV